MQSPIDLLNERVEIVSHLGDLQIKYHPSNATLHNRGHDIQLEWVAGAGYLEINGSRYVLKKCHWHSSSEHTIYGKRFDLELHMVHETEAGETAVIGILYKIGKPDAFLTSLMDHLEALSDKTDAEEVVGTVDPSHIKISSLQYYRYMGSLTTPPCTENVVWTILRQVRTVSKKQVDLLRVAVHDYFIPARRSGERHEIEEPLIGDKAMEEVVGVKEPAMYKLIGAVVLCVFATGLVGRNPEVGAGEDSGMSKRVIGGPLLNGIKTVVSGNRVEN
ncbi:alpha carbonic anhydrase 7-like [Senna tora]|uniref:Carbonic anhydrase n=1 Tax=Senna tora TaxID=362788 RepID=A0A834SKR3_9FABA|nr:alpha carbonic anhydrase 7-like [Senna tora]